MNNVEEKPIELYDTRLRQILTEEAKFLQEWELALANIPDLRSLFSSFGPPSSFMAKDASFWKENPKMHAFQDFLLYALIWYSKETYNGLSKISQDDTNRIVNTGNNNTSIINNLIKQEINNLTKQINNNFTTIVNTNKSDTQRIVNYIQDEHIAESLNQIQEKLDKIIQLLEDENLKVDPEPIVSRIVGESYFKWDNIQQYLPTCVFIFRERTSFSNKKRSTIRSRLPIQTDQFTPEYQQQLKYKVHQHLSMQYIHGLNRYYFVSEDKTFKTTVYVSNQSEGDRVLQTICEIINVPFDKEQTSYTEKKLRKKIYQNKPSITGLKNNPVQYDTNFTAYLFRVVVLINGSEEPVVLYQRQEP